MIKIKILSYFGFMLSICIYFLFIKYIFNNQKIELNPE